MNIPPFLERLLLSNEAVFKNASLGLSGQNMVFVPTGKSAVLLEVSIEPFVNSINPKLAELLQIGYISDNDTTSYQSALQRLHYQLQIINDKYATYINLADCFEIQNTQLETEPNFPKISQVINLKFLGKREPLFIYTDRSMYFNFLYPFKLEEIGANTSGITPDYTTPDVGFLPKIQNLPDTPITFNKNTNQDYLVNAEINSPTLDHYYSVNHQTNPAYATEDPQMEYLRFPAGANQTSIRQPVASGTTYSFHDLMQIPFINVKYALLNKRPDDYGITKPFK